MPYRKSREGNNSVTAPLSGLDVIGYTDRMIGNALLITEGSRLRAITHCMQRLQTVRWFGEPHQVAVFGGLDMVDAVLALLQTRLADEAQRLVADRPIPYALTARALAARRWS